MSNHYDVLIIGGGPAGIQAARLIRGKRPEWRVGVIRPEDASMIYCAIPYVLEGLLDAEKVRKCDSLVTGVEADLIRNLVVGVNVKDRVVKLKSGVELTYETLFIATGSRSLIPPVPGNELNGIFSVKTEEDMHRILQMLDKGTKKVVVVGSGAVGLEQALAMKSRGLEVHLVDMADRILPHMSDEDMSQPITEDLVESGIRLHLSEPLTRFTGTDWVESVVLGSGAKIELEPGKDFVITAVGMAPEIELFKEQLMIGPDGLLVNPEMRTSHPNVFAAGDCVQGWSGIDGGPLGGKLATNAVPMAKVAAENICGGSMQYPGFFNGVATVAGSIRIGGTGFTETYAKTRGYNVVSAYGETTSRFPMMPGATPVKVKLIADRKTKRIIGGQVIGREGVAERIDVITLAIQNKMTAGELAQLSYSAQPWQTFFPARNAIVQAATELNGKLSQK